MKLNYTLSLFVVFSEIYFFLIVVCAVQLQEIITDSFASTIEFASVMTKLRVWLFVNLQSPSVVYCNGYDWFWLEFFFLKLSICTPEALCRS